MNQKKLSKLERYLILFVEKDAINRKIIEGDDDVLKTVNKKIENCK